jgi:hypothetical protein
MNCKFIHDRIADLFDGSLAAGEREKLMAHIESCEDCKLHYREITNLAGMISSTNRPVARKGFSDSLVHEIRKEIKQDSPGIPKEINEFPWKKAFGIAASVLLFAAIALSIILVSVRNPAVAAEKLINRSLLAMLEMKSVQMTFSIRTREHENIDFIDPRGGFLECRLWKTFGNPPKWRMEKAGRMVLMDGTDQYMVTSGSGYVLKGSSEIGFVNWMKIFLDPAKLLESEKEFARSHDASCRIDEKEGKIVLTIKAKAIGNFRNTFALNSSVAESNNTRTYTFNKATMLPESLEVTLEDGSQQIPVIRLEQITYNQPVPDSLLRYIPVNDIPVIPVSSMDSINRGGIRNVSSEEAARIFFYSISARDARQLGRLLPVEALSGGNVLNSIIKAYAGTRLEKLGPSFRSGLYPGDFVPYVLRLPSGDTASGNLALRRDNTSHVWNVDGGY